MVLLAFTPVVLAQKSVEVVTIPQAIVLTTSETATTDVIVKNNQPFADTFTFSVFPSYASGISVTLEKSIMTVEPNSEANVKVYFYTPIDTAEGFFQFFFTAKSLSTGAEDTNSLILQTVRKAPMYISDVKVNKYVFEPGEELKIETRVTNIHPKNSYNYELVVEIRKDGELLQAFVNPVIAQPKETVSVANSYIFGKYAQPGLYSLAIFLRDESGKFVSTKDFVANLMGVYKLPTEYTEKYTEMGFLSLTTTIIIKNDGNVGTPPFYVSEVMPLIAKGSFSSSIPPSNESIRGGSIVYSWYVPYLAPGESIVIKYHVSFVSVWIALIVIGAITYFSYRYTFTATIIKSCKYSGPLKKDNEILVSIDVRNKTTGEMKDVLVTDKVPPVLQVIEKFDTIQPKIKKVKEGTILTWSLGNLNTREERILTYRIKPVLEVAGGLKLPAATLSYSGKKGTQTVLSKSIILSPQ